MKQNRGTGLPGCAALHFWRGRRSSQTAPAGGLRCSQRLPTPQWTPCYRLQRMMAGGGQNKLYKNSTFFHCTQSTLITKTTKASHVILKNIGLSHQALIRLFKCDLWSTSGSPSVLVNNISKNIHPSSKNKTDGLKFFRNWWNSTNDTFHSGNLSCQDNNKPKTQRRGAWQREC